MKKTTIDIQGQPVRIEQHENGDYICITDIAKSGEGSHLDIVKNYLKNSNNIAFLCLWEQKHNSNNFNSVAANLIRIKSSANNFTISVKEWTKQTNAIGMTAKAGKYGGTYAHRTIATHFATWFSPHAYLHLIDEFERLKANEMQGLKRNSEMHVRLITDRIDDVRNLLDTIPDQDPKRNRLNWKEEDE